MDMKNVLPFGVLMMALLIAAPAGAQAPAPDGADLYKRSCASCHDAGVNRAPLRDAFRSMPSERVLAAIETGSMVSMANNRTAAERRAIVEFVTGRPFSEPLVTTPAASAMCTSSGGARFNPAAGARWDGWGLNPSNTRFQSQSGLAAADVPR